MRKRKTGGVPVQVYNLGSPAGTQFDFARDELWNRMNAEMGKKAVSLPVFLVNSDQMDTLYPREYRRALDPERIRQLLQEEPPREARERRREEQAEEPDFFDRLQRNEEDWLGWSKYSKIVTVGLYCSFGQHDTFFRQQILRQDEAGICTSEAESAFLNHQGSAIFLCCERVLNWANRAGVSHHLVVDMVYYHELGHAMLDTLPSGAPNPYHEIWGRIVEESLTNAIAYHCFDGKEARWIQRLIHDQPAEYLGYAAAGQLLFGQVSTEFWEQLRDLWWDDPRWLHRWREWYWSQVHLIEHLRAVLHSVSRYRTTARDAITLLGYLSPFGMIPLQVGHMHSVNISAWKLFKRLRNHVVPEEVQIWKDFAKYLLIEGVG